MSQKPTILILNGPNLNMLGKREPEIYGSDTLADLDAACIRHAAKLGLGVECYQSNEESALIAKLHQAFSSDIAGIIINAGAYTHTSIALMDALLIIKAPIMEVHLSNIFKREAFRHQSYISRAATGVICGLGKQGYLLALEALAELVELKA